jgi:hypothetical protein
MTEQPASAPPDPTAEDVVGGDAADSPTGPGDAVRTTLGDALRWLAVAACAGAAVIHFAYAPTHLEEDATHGTFFLVTGWLQLGLAFALARWRTDRRPWVAAGAVNAVVAAVWLLTRTAGLPGEDPEPVGFPDTLATALEVVVVLAAVAALRPAWARRPSFGLHPLVGGAAAVALAAVVSASVTPSIAGEHQHDEGGGHDHAVEGESAASGGHDHGSGAAAQVDPDDRCDLGFNTAAFNEVSVPGMPHAHDDGAQVDFTLDEWADVFVDPANGIPPAVVADFVEERPILRDGILSGGLTHTLAPDPWNPLTDPDECEALADELTRAKEVAAAYPTIAEAEAAGYRKVTTYYPGIAAHYMNFDYVDGAFELEKPEMLLYDGDGPTAGIVGLSYYIVKEGEAEPTEGFTGDNDHYHRHVGLCIREGVVAAGSTTSEEDCGAIGGAKSDGTAGWMSHVWITPGCESDWGVFSGANPTLKVRGLDTTGAMPRGCGTGKTMADQLAFDDSGDGPSL